MFIVHVDIHVKPEAVEAFKKATLANAQASLKESGVFRFDFFQDSENPAHFILVEVYRNVEATTAHRETAHYQAWRAVADPIMAQTRKRTVLNNVFPGDEGWQKS